MLRRSTTAAACAVALLAVGAAPATALTQPVDIAVLLASTTAEDSPVKAFLAEGVTVGDGPELTAADLAPESDDICGAVEVDIDPDAQTVTVTAVEDEGSCELGVVSVAVLSDEIASFTLESDDLVTFEPSGDDVVELDQTPGTVAAAWIAGDEQVLVLGGSAVFAYELAEATPTPTPTATPTPTPTSTATPAPTATPTAPAQAPTKAAAPARPVVAQPTFTG